MIKRIHALEQALAVSWAHGCELERCLEPKQNKQQEL